MNAFMLRQAIEHLDSQAWAGDSPENGEVGDAAVWLDLNYPGWADKINLAEFDMGGSHICIGHYLRVDWYNDLCLPWTAASGRHYEHHESQVFASFTNLWRLEIQARKTPPRVVFGT